MNYPFFSVIIPTYNRAPIILRAVNSVLQQTFKEFEIIISDDGSSDNTREVIENLHDRRVIYHFQNNGGVSQARNSGAAKANGKFLIFLDSDDLLTPGYLQALFIELNKGDYVIGFGYAKYFNPLGKEFLHVHPEKRNGVYGPKLAGAFAISKIIFNDIGGYDTNLYYSENTELLLRVMLGKKATDDSICLIPLEGVWVNFRDARERFNAYSKLKYKSVGYFLKKHEAYFMHASDTFVSYKTIYALGAFQNGESSEAITSIKEVIKKRPLRVKAYFQYLLFTFPALAKLYYRN